MALRMREPVPNGDSIDLARQVLETEAQAILGLIPQLGPAFAAALQPPITPAEGVMTGYCAALAQ